MCQGKVSVAIFFFLSFFFPLIFISRNVMLVVDEGGRNGSCSLGAARMKQMYVETGHL